MGFTRLWFSWLTFVGLLLLIGCTQPESTPTPTGTPTPTPAGTPAIPPTPTIDALPAPTATAAVPTPTSTAIPREVAGDASAVTKAVQDFFAFYQDGDVESMGAVSARHTVDQPHNSEAFVLSLHLWGEQLGLTIRTIEQPVLGDHQAVVRVHVDLEATEQAIAGLASQFSYLSWIDLATDFDLQGRIILAIVEDEAFDLLVVREADGWRIGGLAATLTEAVPSEVAHVIELFYAAIGAPEVSSDDLETLTGITEGDFLDDFLRYGGSPGGSEYRPGFRYQVRWVGVRTAETIVRPLPASAPMSSPGGPPPTPTPTAVDETAIDAMTVQVTRAASPGDHWGQVLFRLESTNDDWKIIDKTDGNGYWLLGQYTTPTPTPTPVPTPPPTPTDQTAIATFVTSWGTQGRSDGQFSYPNGIAVHESGKIYVVDTFNQRVQVFTAAGEYLTKWGIRGSADGQFSGPQQIAIDDSGNIYVTDTGLLRMQVFTAAGEFLRMWGGGPGNGDGQFSSLNGIAVDESGKIYVGDGGNRRVQVFSPLGEFLAKWGSEGDGDGQFNLPLSIAVAKSGDVYVSDLNLSRVQVFSNTGDFVRELGPPGVFDGQFDRPMGIAVDESGRVYVLDSGNARVQVFSATGEFLGKWGAYGSGDGQFNVPQGIAVDKMGNVYVSDTGNRRVQMFKLHLP